MGTREDDGVPTEAALERTLTVVGPLLGRRARVASPDPAFVGTLCARLLVTGTTPDPAFVRALRVRLRGAVDGDGGARGSPPSPWCGWTSWWSRSSPSCFSPWSAGIDTRERTYAPAVGCLET